MILKNIKNDWIKNYKYFADESDNKEYSNVYDNNIINLLKNDKVFI